MNPLGSVFSFATEEEALALQASFEMLRIQRDHEAKVEAQREEEEREEA